MHSHTNTQNLANQDRSVAHVVFLVFLNLNNYTLIAFAGGAYVIVDQLLGTFFFFFYNAYLVCHGRQN